MVKVNVLAKAGKELECEGGSSAQGGYMITSIGMDRLGKELSAVGENWLVKTIYELMLDE